jgi:hypothetical protein
MRTGVGVEKLDVAERVVCGLVLPLQSSAKRTVASYRKLVFEIAVSAVCFHEKKLSAGTR